MDSVSAASSPLYPGTIDSGPIYQMLAVSKHYANTTGTRHEAESVTHSMTAMPPQRAQVPGLHQISLSIERATTCVLIGPSGCGKTTLLRILAGLEQVSAGQVLFQAQAIPTQSAALQQYRQRLGYVIQEGGLFPHLNAFDNVALAARHQAWSKARIQQRIDALRELVQLPHNLLQRFPQQMSGGQRQRVALIRALMLEPEVLLLDEPLGALDPMIRYELQCELKQTFQSLGKTVILVTHDLAEAAWFSDDLVLLRQGEIVQRGSLGQLLDAPATPFVSAFVQAQRGLTNELAR